MNINNEELLLHLQKWHNEQTPLFVAYSSPVFEVQCSFNGRVDAVNGEKIIFAHKAGRQEALLSLSLSKAKSLSYYQWDDLDDLDGLEALKPIAEEWMTERPVIAILFPNQTAVVLSDLSSSV